jgi:hypothetical protein
VILAVLSDPERADELLVDTAFDLVPKSPDE